MSAAKLSLLIIDDNAGDHDLVRLALDDVGINADVAVAWDGGEGRTALAERLATGRLPHVVLLDVNMPKMGGREVLRWLRGEPGLATLPVIVFTSSQAPTDRADCLALGAREYWTKPSDFRTFCTLIARLAVFAPTSAGA